MSDWRPLLIVVIFLVVWLVPAAVIMLRGRNTWAALALFLPIINLLILWKAVREPATPASYWSEHFYGDNMMQVSQERYPMTSMVRGTYSENKELAAQQRVKRHQRKQRNKTRKSKRKEKLKAFRRPTDKIAEAKKRDKKASS